MSTLPWYIGFSILFFPLAVSTISSLFLNIMMRRINRQEGGKAWTIKKNFLMALIVSSPLAGLISLLLQGQLEKYIYIQNGFHLIVFDMLMAPFAVLILQNFLLFYFQKKKWENAYRFVRVKHEKPAEYYADDVSDLTVNNYKVDNNDIREE